MKEIVHKRGLIPYTHKSVTDPKQFIREVEETRKRGYAVDREEYLLGVTAIAVPIQSASLPPAAVWVVGFTSSLNEKKIEKNILEIQKTGQDISTSLKDHLG
jgi:DNA-binding IclR family transcriptional regulator